MCGAEASFIATHATSAPPEGAEVIVVEVNGCTSALRTDLDTEYGQPRC